MVDPLYRPEMEELFRWADQLPEMLWQDVTARPAVEAAECVGADYADGVFRVAMLGAVYAVDTQTRRIDRDGRPDHRVSFQSGVVLLTSLARSMGVPPSGRMVSPVELQGGRMFFTGAHTLAETPIAQRYGRTPEALVARVTALGGIAAGGLADCAVRLDGLPRLPLHVLLWTEAPEQPARAMIGIDDRALFHLDLAGVFALTNILAARLVGTHA
jgi:hypothetical protein